MDNPDSASPIPAGTPEPSPKPKETPAKPNPDVNPPKFIYLTEGWEKDPRKENSSGRDS